MNGKDNKMGEQGQVGSQVVKNFYAVEKSLDYILQAEGSQREF